MLRIGYRSDGQMWQMPLDDVKHVLTLGATGAGKTTTFELMVRESIRLGLGFLVIDPHGGLARSAAAYCAAKGLDYVYVAPQLTATARRVVKVNPLAAIEPYDIDTIIDQMRHIYDKGWGGDRMEAIFRNTFRVVMLLGRPYRRFPFVRDWIINKDVRDTYITQIPDKHLQSYWQDVFDEQYRKDAGSAAYNKLDRLISNPFVQAMMDGQTADGAYQLDFTDAVTAKKRIIIDLSVIDQSTASFVGAMILLMFYSAVKRMKDRLENKGVDPFVCIIDEAQYVAPVLREIINYMRKARVILMLGTQALDGLSDEMMKPILELVSTFIVFRVGKQTLTFLGDILPLPKEKMETLESYTFAAASSGRNQITCIGYTRPMSLPPELDVSTPAGRQNVDASIGASLLTYGQPVDVDKYAVLADSRPYAPKVSFLEYAVLCHVYGRGGSVPYDGFRDRFTTEQLPDMAGYVKPEDVGEAVRRLEQRYYVQRLREDPNAPGHDGSTRFTLVMLQTAMEEFFLPVPRGQRGGSDKHWSVMQKITALQAERFNFTVIDDGRSNAPRPDVVVVPHSRRQLSASRMVEDWDYDAVQAWEVETDPAGNAEQVWKNYDKSARKGHAVNFVVFSEPARGAVMDILARHGVGADSGTFRVWLESEIPLAGGKHGQNAASGGSFSQNAAQGGKYEHEIPHPLAGQSDIPTTPPPPAKVHGAGALLKAIRRKPKDPAVVEALERLGYSVTYPSGGQTVRVRRYGDQPEDHEYKIKTT